MKIVWIWVWWSFLQAFHFDLPPAEANRALKAIARGKQAVVPTASACLAALAASSAAADADEDAAVAAVATAAAAPLSLAEAAAAVALALSNGLPRGVCVRSVTPAPGLEGLNGFDFHARESCRGKRYVYTVAEGGGGGDPFLARQAWVLGKRLNVVAMQQVRELALLSACRRSFMSCFLSLFLSHSSYLSISTFFAIGYAF